MPRKPTDWKQKYEKSIIQTKRDVENIFDLRKELDNIQERHKGLNKEFDKAVAINKQFQETIVEQRGIINYLELQIKKLDEKLTKTEKPNERT